MDVSQVSSWFVDMVAQTRRTFELHVPSDLLPGPDWAGLTLVAAGLLLGIYGSHYARVLLTLALGGVGYLVGTVVAERMQLQQPILGGAIGAVVLAGITYVTFRFWVGVAVALLAATVGLAVFGHDSVWPAFLDYRPNPITEPVAGGDEYVLLPPDVQQANRHPNPAAYLAGFYDTFKQDQPLVAKRGTLITILCLVGGFILGAVGTKLALMLSSAVAGTLLFGAGLASLAEAWAPAGWESRLSDHPNGLLVFIGACLLLSLLVQIRIARGHNSSKPVDNPTK